MPNRIPIAAAAPGLLLIAAGVVSLGVHVAGIVVAKDQSLGALGPSGLKQMPTSLAIERIADDWLPQAPRLADSGIAQTLQPQDTNLNAPDPEQAVEAIAPPPTPLPDDAIGAQDLTQLATVAPPDITLSDLPPAPIDNPAGQDILAALQAANVEGLALHQPPTIPDLPAADLLTPGQGGHPGSASTFTDPPGLPEALAPGTPGTPGAQSLNALLDSAPPPLPAPGTSAPLLSGDELIAALPPALAAPSVDDAVIAQAQWLPAIQLDDAFDYHVQHQLQPQAPHHFTVRISPRPKELQALDPMPKDVLFLIDTSSSIAKSIVREVFAGVTRGLGALNPQDRFNIAVFSRETQTFANTLWTPATDASKAQAAAFLGRITPGGSHTDVNQALSFLLSQSKKNASRVMNVVIISDGKPTQGITDTKDLINELTQRNRRIASVYCVAVTSRANTDLLDYLAYRNGGRSVVASKTDTVADTIATLCSQLRYPLIRDVSLSIVGSGADDVHPIALADIHLNQPFSIYGRFQTQGPFTIRIAGTGLKDGQVQPVDFTFVRDLRESRPGPSSIAEQWAFWRLHHLYSEQIRLGDRTPFGNEIRTLERTRRRRR